MERGGARAKRTLAGLQHTLSDSAVGSSRALSLAPSGPHGQTCSARLAAALRASYLLVGNLRRYFAFSRALLSRGQLAGDWYDGRPRASSTYFRTDAASEADAGLAFASEIPRGSQPIKRPRMDVNLEELDQIIERGTHTPLSASESEKLKLVLHALAAMLPQPRTTEKTKDVLEQSAASAPESEPGPAGEKKPGHGRNGA